MRKRRAIIFDDEPVVLLVLKDFFETRGYEVLAFREPVICPVYGNTTGCTNKALAGYCPGGPRDANDDRNRTVPCAGPEWMQTDLEEQGSAYGVHGRQEDAGHQGSGIAFFREAGPIRHAGTLGR